MADLFEHLQFAFAVTGPILILLLLGIILRRISFLDEHFIQLGNKLVFNITLPIMLFFSVADQPMEEVLDTPLVSFGVLATIGSVVLIWLTARPWVQPEKLGVFTQGAFRGNMAIIGLALTINAYGPEILSQAGIYVAVVTIAYNVLAVWLLGDKGDSHFLRILSNPLIIGIVAGFAVSLSGFTLPVFLVDSGSYLNAMTLPLALLCVGGSLSWQGFKSNHRDVVAAAIYKLLLIPALVVCVALVLGFKNQQLGILFLMMASPTAAASYVMAKQMTAYGQMAAEIVAVSTAISPITITAGLVILKSLQFV